MNKLKENLAPVFMIVLAVFTYIASLITIDDLMSRTIMGIIAGCAVGLGIVIIEGNIKSAKDNK